jgi:hypothetical protein
MEEFKLLNIRLDDIIKYMFLTIIFTIIFGSIILIFSIGAKKECKVSCFNFSTTQNLSLSEKADFCNKFCE